MDVEQIVAEIEAKVADANGSLDLYQLGRSLGNVWLPALKAALSSAAGAGGEARRKRRMENMGEPPEWDMGECSWCLYDPLEGGLLGLVPDAAVKANMAAHEAECWRPASPAPEDAAKASDSDWPGLDEAVYGAPAAATPPFWFDGNMCSECGERVEEPEQAEHRSTCWYGLSVMSPEEQGAQRRSFAHGNAAIDNPNVTRAVVDAAAEKLGPPAAARGYRPRTDYQTREMVLSRARGKMHLHSYELPMDVGDIVRDLKDAEAESEERNEEILNLRAACMDETGRVLQRDEEIRDLRGKLAASEARAEAMREALTPSGSTKAAYMGEFRFSFRSGMDVDGSDEFTNVEVPWTAIKDIMAAITKRAAASARGKEAGRG
jgi:hypothetical protein